MHNKIILSDTKSSGSISIEDYEEVIIGLNGVTTEQVLSYRDEGNVRKLKCN